VLIYWAHMTTKVIVSTFSVAHEIGALNKRKGISHFPFTLYVSFTIFFSPIHPGEVLSHFPSTLQYGFSTAFHRFFSQLGFAVLAVARVVVTFAVRRFDLIKMIIVFGI